MAVKKKTSTQKKTSTVKSRKTSKTVAAKKQTTSKSTGVSKFETLRQMFPKRGAKHSLEEIVKKTGFDERNARTAIYILKSKTRTAHPIRIERNAEGLYVRK